MLKPRLMARLLSILSFLLLVILLNGCSQPDLKGTISISGSTTIQPISNKLADAFKENHPNCLVVISGGGSGAGILDVDAGKVDIGSASRELSSTEPKLKKYLLGRDGIAVVTHPSNSARALSKEQIIKLFSGEIKNWKELGGKDSAVKVVTREPNSGTLGAFQELVMGVNQISSGAIVEPGNNQVRSFVSINLEAIGFLSVGYVDSTVHAVSVNSIDCSLENCKEGRYPFVRPLYYLTKNEPTGIVKVFLDLATGKDGQKMVENEGYLGVN